MNEEEKKSLDEFLGEVHGEESPIKDLDLKFDMTITKKDVECYVNRHPFLQLLNLDPTFEDFEKVKLITATSGWVVQDFGDALSTSQGELFFDDFGHITLFEEAHKARLQEAAQTEEEGGGETGQGEGGGEGETGSGGSGETQWDDSESDLRPGAGTVVKQAVDTATAMVELVKERWKGVHIVAGAEVMKWAAWRAATGYNLEVYGYEPSTEAQTKRSVLERAALKKASARKQR